PEQDGSAPFGWHRDFADARNRLRDWVAASGTRLDRDRPTRQTTWPGEDPADPVEDVFVADRDQDFVDYVAGQVAERRAAEDAFFAGADPETGEIRCAPRPSARRRRISARSSPNAPIRRSPLGGAPGSPGAPPSLPR